MAAEDRARWNRRYGSEGYDYSPPPWLVELAPRLRPAQPGQARALDIACGPGRNALCLARLGYVVDAWDISDVALAMLREELARHAAERLQVTPREVDLEAVELPIAAYELILDSHYLDRRLCEPLSLALRPGGILVVRTLLQTADGKYNPAHAFEPGELRRAFPDLIELDYDEDRHSEVAYLLAEKPAASQSREMDVMR